MQEKWIRQADFLQNLFDAIPSLLFMVDTDLRVTHLNAAALRFTNRDRESALQQRGGDLLHCIRSFETPEGCGHSSYCDDCAIRRSMEKAFQGKKVYRETIKMSLLTDNHTQDIHYLMTTSPVRYEGCEFALLIMEDITELKKYEQELRQYASRLEAAYKDMESFTYSASHDLRAPLITISGFARLLMEDHSEKLDEQVKGLLGIIGKNARKMEQLLRDLLKFSHLSTKEIQRQEINMEALVNDAFEDLKPGLGERRIEVEIKPLLPSRGDLSMLRQVIINLVSNAIKYSHKVEKARIEVGCTRQKDENVYYVRDNGVGFDMQLSGRLFGLFSRLHSPDDFEGTGIGLVIVKRIIEKHGGKVWAESKQDEGATFYFSLPRQQS